MAHHSEDKGTQREGMTREGCLEEVTFGECLRSMGGKSQTGDLFSSLLPNPRVTLCQSLPHPAPLGAPPVTQGFWASTLNHSGSRQTRPERPHQVCTQRGGGLHAPWKPVPWDSWARASVRCPAGVDLCRCNRQGQGQDQGQEGRGGKATGRRTQGPGGVQGHALAGRSSSGRLRALALP